MYAEDELLPVSALQHLLFCERRAALICLERLWQDNTATVEGSIMHERTHQDGTESRPDIRIARGLWLRSLKYGLYGMADVIEFHRATPGSPGSVNLPGDTGSWIPYPVEYKRGRLRGEASFEVQVCAQAMCLEEMLGITVQVGALYYGKSRKRKEILFDATLRSSVESASLRLHQIIASSLTPQVSSTKKCRFCSMNEICLPGLSRKGRKVAQYLKEVTLDKEYQSETSP